MFCTQCGTQMPEEGGFCPECGAQMTAPEVAAEAVEPEPVEAAEPAPDLTFDPVPVAPATPAPPFTPAPIADQAFTPQPYSAPGAATGSIPTATQAPQASFNPNVPPAPTAASFGQGPVPAPVPYGQGPAPVPAPAPPKKSKKKLIFIIGAVVLVILIAIGVVVGYNIYRSSNYDKAVAALDAGDYQTALDGFAGLGDYEDSASLMALAQQNLDYQAAEALFDAENFEAAKAAFEALGGFKDAPDRATASQWNIDYIAATAAFEANNYTDAKTLFSELASAGFKDSDVWVDKCNYAIADGLYTDGDYYGAYQAFMALGSYDDSVDRMNACTTPYPGTGETYHNGDYVSSRSSIVIDAGNSTAPNYFKIYAGDTLVSSLFINAGGKLEVELPSYTYTIKQASGSAWFGEEIMFGDEGWYEVMLFNGGATSFDLGDNIIATITLAISSNEEGYDRIGSDSTDRESF